MKNRISTSSVGRVTFHSAITGVLDQIAPKAKQEKKVLFMGIKTNPGIVSQGFGHQISISVALSVSTRDVTWSSQTTPTVLTILASHSLQEARAERGSLACTCCLSTCLRSCTQHIHWLYPGHTQLQGKATHTFMQSGTMGSHDQWLCCWLMCL